MNNVSEPHKTEPAAPRTEEALVKVTRRLVFATVALAIVSLLGFGVGLLQWYTFNGQLTEMRSSSAQTEKLISANDELAKAARAANETNREALHSIQRAFVSVTHYTPAVLKKGSEANFLMTIVWEDSGNTPARNLEFQTACFVETSGYTQPLNLRDVCQKEGSSCSTATAFLGPHETFAGGSCWLSPDTISKIQNGSQHFYILGTASYRDIFEGTKHHITRSCTEISEVRGDPSSNLSEISVDLPPCKDTINCPDEDCDSQ